MYPKAIVWDLSDLILLVSDTIDGELGAEELAALFTSTMWKQCEVVPWQVTGIVDGVIRPLTLWEYKTFYYSSWMALEARYDLLLRNYLPQWMVDLLLLKSTTMSIHIDDHLAIMRFDPCIQIYARY